MDRYQLDYKMVLVNDGSTDRTLEAIEAFTKSITIELCSYHPNCGVGEALRRGFDLALKIAKDNDVIITSEADNTSDLGILDEMIQKIRDGYDLALASCYTKGGGVQGTTFFRMILSRSANILLRLFFFRRGIHTYSSFYRAYKSRALREVSRAYGKDLIKENGFECMVELLVKFLRNNKFRICEVPMVLDGRRREDKSKMRVVQTTFGFLKVIFQEGIIYQARNMLLWSKR